jgi:23S rRNA pseudouridine1911/1915/1917 synthase
MSTPPAPLGLTADEVRPHAGERLDVYLAARLERSRSQVQGLLKRGLVRVEPAPAKSVASYRLRAGDSITVAPEPDVVTAPDDAPAGEAIPLEIIYEDAAMLALNKQAGLVVHPAAGNWTGTLVNALVHHRGADLAERGGRERLGIVHRLDKDTSGVILIAKTDEAHEKLSRAFAERTMKKFYRALCRGRFRVASGSVRLPIGRHPRDRKKMAVIKDAHRSREAWTDYRVQQQGEHGAEVECLLHTGRTHQIRVHLAHLTHPIWGDTLYGRSMPVAGFQPGRQMLHAARIELAHPITGKPLVIEAPLPGDYLAARGVLLTGRV